MDLPAGEGSRRPSPAQLGLGGQPVGLGFGYPLADLLGITADIAGGPVAGHLDTVTEPGRGNAVARNRHPHSRAAFQPRHEDARRLLHCSDGLGDHVLLGDLAALAQAFASLQSGTTDR